MKRNSKYVAAGLGLAQLALITVSAVAQEQPVRSLNEVVVTASRSPRKQSEIGKVVRIISSEQLSRSQGRTLPELLGNVAGITIGGEGNNPADVKAVYLRGAAPGNTLILVDGIPVNDASNISGEFEIGGMAIDQIERIEILKGGNSTLYGSDAVAGVINIITKQGHGKPSANVLFTGGTSGTYKEAVGVSGQLKRTSVALNASNLDSKGFSTASVRPGSDVPDFERDDFHQKSASLNLRQFVTSRWSVKGNLQYNFNDAALDAGAFSDASGYRYDKTFYLLGLGSKWVFGRGNININVSRNMVRNKFDNNGSVTDNKGNIMHSEAIFNYTVSPLADLTAGGSIKQMRTDQESPYGILSADSARNTINSVFASMFFKTDGGFRAEIGGRYNYHSEYGQNFTYTINPSYVFNGRYKFFVNVSSAYKVPSLYQLYSQYGNLLLKPEVSETYESGFDLDLIQNKLNLNFSLFSRNITDVIDFGQMTSGSFGYINQNKQKDHGFETEVSFKSGDRFDFSAYHAYVHGKVTTPAGTDFNLFRRPANTFGTMAGVKASPTLFVQLTYKWCDDRKDRYFDYSNPPGQTVTAELGNYQLLDAYLQYRPKSMVMLFADVKNILDTDYTEFVGYNTKGINFNAGIKVELK